MNKYFLSLLILTLWSCDSILLKDTDKPSIETNEKTVAPQSLVDEKGCASSAGYKWSAIKNKCIRPVEEGFRLNNVQESTNFEAAKSAYLLFDNEKETAEIFFPEQTSAVVFTKANDIFVFKNYKLFSKPNYRITRNDTLIYVAAKTADKPISGKIEND